MKKKLAEGCITSIGVCLVEHRVGDDQFYFAGDTLNVALYLARLVNDDIIVQYATALSNDELSEQMRCQWQQEGIDLSAVTTLSDHGLGQYWIELDDHGERSFRYQRDDSAARYMFKDRESADVLGQAIERSRWVYLSAISLAILDQFSRDVLFGILQTAKASGSMIIMDNNYRAALWADGHSCCEVLHRFEGLTDVALYSLDDAQDMLAGSHLTPEGLIEQLKNHGVSRVVIKAGRQGYWLSDGGCDVVHQSVRIVDVIDSTAAGDSFNAGFLYGLISGQPMNKCADFGYQLASQVVRHAGAIMPRNAMPLLD